MVGKIQRQLKSLPLLAKLSIALLLLLLLAFLLFISLRPHRKSPPGARPPAPPSPPANGSMDPNTVVEFDFSPFLILYKSGRVHRLDGTDRVAAGVDAATGVTSKDVVIDPGTGLAARMYLPTPGGGTAERLPIFVNYHGGAFVIQSAFSPTYHDYLNALVAEARVVAVSVEYRLAPEHPLPVAYDDSWQALGWVVQNAGSGPEPWLRDRGDLSRLFLAGDSAGGNIAHNMGMRAGREGLAGAAAIKGILLFDPYFWGKEPVGTETTDPETRHRYEVTWAFVCAGKYGIDDPLVNPVAMPAEEWRKLACERAAVTVSELDDFRERGKAYAEALNASGWPGRVELYETGGEDHVYYLSKPQSPKAVKEMAFVSGFLNRP